MTEPCKCLQRGLVCVCIASLSLLQGQHVDICIRFSLFEALDAILLVTSQ